jgi:hypothetical protein
MRWLKDEENDSWEMKVKIWGQKANNREECAFVLKETKLSEDCAAKK